jgi:hypothetical protein
LNPAALPYLEILPAVISVMGVSMDPVVIAVKKSVN